MWGSFFRFSVAGDLYYFIVEGSGWPLGSVRTGRRRPSRRKLVRPILSEGPRRISIIYLFVRPGWDHDQECSSKDGNRPIKRSQGVKGEFRPTYVTTCCRRGRVARLS